LEIFHHFYQLQNYDSAFNALWNCDDFLTLRGHYADQVELYGQLISKWKEVGDRENWNYRASLTSLGIAYDSLGQYQQAIDFFQQSLDIAREIGDHNGEAIAWFNLGLALENVNRESDALGAYRNARELYQTMNPSDGSFADTMRSMIALQRYGQSEEVADMVSYLASAEVGFVTGASLEIDGGFAA
jgi:tetratricopeptide (TPR) repeat protein